MMRKIQQPAAQRTTGNRCAIFESIDSLDEAKSVHELVKRLKPILNELAYYGINGEAAILESREEWHSQYGDELHRDGAAQQQGAAARQGMPPSRSTSRSNVPPSLRSIMDGSHHSLSANY